MIRRWTVLCLLFLLPLFAAAVSRDIWFWAPPKPVGDGPDYDAIGYCLASGRGWCTHFSDPTWRAPYEHWDAVGYSIQLNRIAPLVPDTNRPPLFPTWIAFVYSIVPREPYGFAVVRMSLAISIALGCALSAAWGRALAARSNSPFLRRNGVWVPWVVIVTVYSERNLRNYATDFLTEPFALLGMSMLMLVTWQLSHAPSRLRAFSAGALTSLLILCRSAFVLWLPVGMVLGLLLLFFSRIRSKSRYEVRNQTASTTPLILMCVLGFGAVIAPWWIRNVVVLESFSPLGTKGPTTLLGGYCDEAVSMKGEWVFTPEKNLRAEMNQPWVERNGDSSAILRLEKSIADESSRRVKAWAFENIKILPKLMLDRLITEWNPYTGKQLALKIAALIGIIYLFVADRQILFWLSTPLILNSIVVSFVYSLGGRFLVPTYGCYYLLIAFGCLGLIDLIARMIRIPTSPLHAQSSMRAQSN